MVRLKETLTRKNVYGDKVRTIKAGKKGTIIDVLVPEVAFEVEFLIAEPQFDQHGELLDAGEWHTLTLEADQIEPVEWP